MSFQDFGFGLLYQRGPEPPNASTSGGRSSGRRYDQEYSETTMKKQIYFPDPPGTRSRNSRRGTRQQHLPTSSRHQSQPLAFYGRESAVVASPGRAASPESMSPSIPILIESRTTRKTSGYQNPPPPTPALTTRCPVTQRLLMEDSSVSGAVTDDSVDQSSAMVESRNSQSPSFLLDDASGTDGDDGNGPFVSRNRSASRGRVPSIYSHLTSEIVNFQKMVSELESLLVPSSTSHEAQWRARILMRSAQDADRDICKKLYEFDSNNGGNEERTSRAQIANRKLHRDFGRAHKQYTTILEQYEKRQQVEVSFLSSAPQPILHGRKQNQKSALIEDEEDFFDRAMRERENELKHIRESVHKVNEIYSDLAALVGDQQEKVDKVAENINYSVGATKAAAEQIHYASHGMCVPLHESFGVGAGGLGWGRTSGNRNKATNVTDDSSRYSKSQFQRNGSHRIGESFSWSMPFETLQDDFRSVQKDVFQFGREIVEDISENLDYPNTIISATGLQCSAFECPTGGRR